MKTFPIALISLALAAPVMSDTGSGAELELKWHDMEKFTDVRATNSTQSQFHDRVKREFEDIFQQLASQLPEGYSWQATITDIDLAGHVDYFVAGAGNPLRVVEDIHSPAITFTHVLTDKQGEVVVSKETKLRDMGFMHSLRPTNDDDAFRYEEQMLEDWFKKELEPKVSDYARVK
ncbi:DUF3016 domain-containing protein [Arsukibacterium sp.]|uniref:DUF3016 domain-containing protein n=1 Tax=Arsukibacterium sp. TaxID=1977258 RepID=UPI00299DFF93|nr:DUF3016 domain-containing protein [Arsukibacterium sp.]MDX1676564.1 DUF3016 domain-containing protein [Arsukibacterium sp.]